VDSSLFVIDRAGQEIAFRSVLLPQSPRRVSCLPKVATTIAAAIHNTRHTSHILPLVLWGDMKRSRATPAQAYSRDSCIWRTRTRLRLTGSVTCEEYLTTIAVVRLVLADEAEAGLIPRAVL